jgi:glycosyltransferase involved in cell wall biosynthesis
MLERPDIMCLFVGDLQGRKKYFKELQLLINKFNKKNNFRIINHQIDMAAIYKLADVVVSASLDPEAFGRVVAEAQAMGRPTLAANHGGASEIIIDGVTGWLFKAGDAIDLADKINKALSLSQDDRKKMAINAIERIKLNFNNEMMCVKTLKVYEELVNK